MDFSSLSQLYHWRILRKRFRWHAANFVTMTLYGLTWNITSPSQVDSQPIETNLQALVFDFDVITSHHRAIYALPDCVSDTEEKCEDLFAANSLSWFKKKCSGVSTERSDNQKIKHPKIIAFCRGSPRIYKRITQSIQSPRHITSNLCGARTTFTHP